MLMVLGWQAFNALPITRFPNIDVPLVAVTVMQSGAAPAEMEAQVTKQIEDAVAGITGVKNIISTVTDGVSTTAVEFRMEVPTDKAVQDVKDAIDQIQGDLPGDVEAPIVTRIDVEGQAIMIFGVSAPDMALEELSWFVDDKITRSLQGRPGVGRVDRYGGAEREIRIELDPVKLDSFGITASAVNAQLRATNTDLGAGRARIGSSEQAIRTLGDAATAESLAKTTIALPSGRFVRLGDLGEIVDTYQELRSFSRMNGEQVVTFAVFRAKGASEVSVAETVNQVLDKIRAENPEVAISLVDDTVFYTYGNYEAALHTLIEGAILAVLVVLAFLKNWRATLIAAVALPLSAVPTFWIMDLLGFSLNLVSFLAITLATGILVDDAIVEIENIARHIRMGKTPYRAAIEAADEIGLAVIATSATIVAVFVPVSFMPGIPGQYFRQFGLTVAIAVIFSLLVARLITPMMAAYLMRDKDADEHEQADGWIMRGYLRVVKATTSGHLWVIPARYLTLVAAIGVLAVSLFFMLRIPGSFIPPEDVSRIPISVELPPGATLEETDRTTQKLAARIRDIDGVNSVFVLGGTSPTGDRDVRRASVTVLLDKLDHSLVHRLSQIAQGIPVVGPMLPEVPAKGRTRPQSQIEAEIFTAVKSIPDVRVFKLNDRGERDLSFSILSSNEQDLNTAVALLEAALRGDPALADVASEGALPRPEIQITPRKEEAARLGITTAQIAEVIRVATIGETVHRQPVDPGQGAAEPGLARGSCASGRAEGAGGKRHCRTPEFGGRCAYCRRSQHGRPPEPRTPRHHRGQPARGRGAWHGNRAVQRDRRQCRASGHSPCSGIWRCRDPAGTDGGLRQCHDHGTYAGADGADPALCQRDPALHDPVLAAAGNRRRGGSPDHDRQPGVDAGADRHPDADGHRHQERHPSGGFRCGDAASRDGPVCGRD
jgi:multidrug efflux pump subunit AcrB